MFAAVNACLRRAQQQQPHRLQRIVSVLHHPTATAFSSRRISSHSRATTKSKSSTTAVAPEPGKFKKPWTTQSGPGRYAKTSASGKVKPKRGVRPAGSNFKRFPSAKPGGSTRGSPLSKKEFYAEKKAAAVAKPGSKITPTITVRGHGQQEALKPLQVTKPQPKKSKKRFMKRERSFPTAAASAVPQVVQYPYYIPRNSNGRLPVYTDVRNAGGRYLVMINNVEGDVQLLAKDLSGTLFEDSERLARFRIDTVKEKKLIVRGGHWKEPIMEWLSNKGF